MNNRGFTLIELLVVIAIISLLSSVVLTLLSGVRDKAQYTGALDQLRNIKRAAIHHQIDKGKWAPDVGPGDAPAFVPEYLPTWPDPPGCGEYDWENWNGTVQGGGPEDIDLRVDLETESENYYWCVKQSRENNCQSTILNTDSIEC